MLNQNTQAATPCPVSLVTPSVSSTTLPRVPLSYRWIINDAEIFLERKTEVQSPPFSLILPSNKASMGKQDSSWHLKIGHVVGHMEMYAKISLCQGDLPNRGQRASAEKIDKVTVLLSAWLCVTLYTP